MSYVAALNGAFARVQLAVIAECIAATGTAATFGERYLGERRAAGITLANRPSAASGSAQDEHCPA